MKFNLNLDIKSILILILLVGSIIFFAMWYFKGSDTKDRVKELQKENARIELVRDSLKDINKNLQVEFNKIQENVDKKNEEIKRIESELLKTKQDLVGANNKVKEHQKELAETKKKIEELEKNPIKREDDDLINSLKDKLNK